MGSYLTIIHRVPILKSCNSAKFKSHKGEMSFKDARDEKLDSRWREYTVHFYNAQLTLLATPNARNKKR